jgi:hypothetical protein
MMSEDKSYDGLLPFFCKVLAYVLYHPLKAGNDRDFADVVGE